VLHFWSLAIEEQFYVLYPLLVAFLVGLGALAKRFERDRTKYWFRQAGKQYRRIVGATLVVLVVASLAVTLFAGFSDDRIYLGTDTRASELLIGGLLAVLLFNAKVTGRLARRGAAQSVMIVLGIFALIGSVYLWSTTEQSASWLYRGGFTVYALVSATLITAAILPAGPVAWALALGPLRHLGRISYGVYLYHWPVFLTLRQKAGLETWSLFLVGGAITLVLAELSFHFLEMPIRRGQRLPLIHIRPVRLAPFVAAGIAVIAIVVTATGPVSRLDFAGTQDRLSALAAEAEALPTTTIDPNALVPPAQPVLATFGDSTALQTSWGLANYMRSSDQGVYKDGFAALGCSVIRTEQRRTPGIGVEESNDTCNDWERIWKEKIDANDPDIAMVQVGAWEVVDRKLPGDNAWRGPGDPMFDDYLFSEMTDAVDVLSSEGAIVVWLTAPPPGTKANQSQADLVSRFDRYEELVNRLPEARPGKVVVVDLADWIRDLPPDEDARIRHDGVHFSTPEIGADTSTEVAERFLGPAVLEAWREQWIANRTAELSAGPPVPLLVVGDETARRIATGLSSWSDAGRRLDVTDAALDECGLGWGGFRLDEGQRERVPEVCNEPEQRLFGALFESSADTALVHTSMWDVTDRQLPGDPTWRAPGDPLYDTYLRDQIAKITDFLNQNGVERVVLLLTPHIDVGREPGQPPKDLQASEPTRIDRLNDLIREVATTRPFVTVLDYAAFARSWPDGEFDPDFRPDGVSPNDAGGEEIAGWLAPQLVDLAQQAARPTPPTEQAAAAGDGG
jgi:hypothetical protein